MSVVDPLSRRLDRISIRWRLALTTAGLAFAILLLFAIIIGVITARQIESSFDDELRLTAVDIEERLDVRQGLEGNFQLVPRPGLVEAVAAGEGVLRILAVDGRVVAASAGAPNLGPPQPGVRNAGDFRVVSRPVRAGPFNRIVAVIQYAKPRRRIRDDIARLKVFLALGVVGGALLGLLAGLAVARRAMGPIAGLTRAANEIARTRDPAISLPRPAADDEVADLARTLERMLKALGDARSETEGALARQREFVADASHELRTPLTSVLVNLELLEAALEGEEEEIASSALRSSQRMRRLVADLLLLARADAGRPSARQPTDLRAVLRAAAAEVEPVAGGHQLEIDAPDEAPVTVNGSPDDLHRLALNLLENAIAHTPPGTAVHATVRREGDTALLEVADEGPGVPVELRERVFERFVRGAGDSGSAGGGSGLGLAIVRAVAEGHGGSVEVGEREGGGARFVVRLPGATAAPGPLAVTGVPS